MVRVFISDINGHIGKALKSAALEAEHEVVGTVEAGEDGGKVAETADVSEATPRAPRPQVQLANVQHTNN